MKQATFMFELALNSQGNINAIVQLPGHPDMIEFEITEKDVKNMRHLFWMKNFNQHNAEEVHPQ